MVWIISLLVSMDSKPLMNQPIGCNRRKHYHKNPSPYSKLLKRPNGFLKCLETGNDLPGTLKSHIEAILWPGFKLWCTLQFERHDLPFVLVKRRLHSTSFWVYNGLNIPVHWCLYLRSVRNFLDNNVYINITISRLLRNSMDYDHPQYVKGNDFVNPLESTDRVLRPSFSAHDFDHLHVGMELIFLAGVGEKYKVEWKNAE